MLNLPILDEECSELTDSEWLSTQGVQANMSSSYFPFSFLEWKFENQRVHLRS